MLTQIADLVITSAWLTAWYSSMLTTAQRIDLLGFCWRDHNRLWADYWECYGVTFGSLPI